MQQRVRKRYRGKIPSSSGQLPVPVALNAELPTLFGLIIHDFARFVNIFFPEFQLNSKLGIIALKPSPGGRWIFRFAPWKGKREKTDEGLSLKLLPSSVKNQRFLTASPRRSLGRSRAKASNEQSDKLKFATG